MEIKKLIRESGVKQWKIAETIGISEATMVRWLRSEVSEDKVNLILSAIDKIKKSMEK